MLLVFVPVLPARNLLDRLNAAQRPGAHHYAERSGANLAWTLSRGPLTIPIIVAMLAG